jgi:hypothetical protein
MSKILVIAGLSPALAAFAVYAAEPVIFPTQNQTRDQQEKDTLYCKGWAQEQTSKSSTASANPQVEAGRGDMARGAAGGAAVGAVFGGGSGAGKGAAAGAAVGAMARRGEKRQAASEQQAAVGDFYNRSLKACMQSKGYTVE